MLPRLEENYLVAVTDSPMSAEARDTSRSSAVDSRVGYSHIRTVIEVGFRF